MDESDLEISLLKKGDENRRNVMRSGKHPGMTKSAVPVKLKKNGKDICVQLIHSCSDELKSNSESQVSTVPEESFSIRTDESPKKRKFALFANHIPRQVIRWKWKWDPSYAKKLPFFVFLVSVIEISVYYLSNERVRRVLVYDPHNRSEVWRFVTYMLLHTDSVHLGLNVIIQCILGTPLEFEQGHLRTAAIYIGGGLGGSLGASVFDAQSLMVGASGGVYALLISQIANIAFNHGTMKYVAYRSLVVVVLAVADISYICYHIYIFNNERPRIGWAAHSAGALSGLFLGFLFFKGTSEWTKTVHILSGFILLILYALAITYNVLQSPPPLNVPS